MERLFDGSPRDFASPFVDGARRRGPTPRIASGAFNRVPVMIGATSADLGGRDGFMIAGARDVAGWSPPQGVPVYAYRFSYVADSGDRTKGAQHATDIPFFLDTARIRYGENTSERDADVAKTVSAYVVHFAGSGDPNGADLPTWPRYDPATDQIMDFTPQGDAVAQRDPLVPAP